MSRVLASILVSSPLGASFGPDLPLGLSILCAKYITGVGAWKAYNFVQMNNPLLHQ